MALRARSSQNGVKQSSVVAKWTRSILHCTPCGKLPRKIKKNNSPPTDSDTNPVAKYDGIFHDGMLSGGTCDSAHRLENLLVAANISINAISALPNSRGMPDEI